MVGWACLPEAPCTRRLTVFSLSMTTVHFGWFSGTPGDGIGSPKAFGEREA